MKGRGEADERTNSVKSERGGLCGMSEDWKVSVCEVYVIEVR